MRIPHSTVIGIRPNTLSGQEVGISTYAKWRVFAWPIWLSVTGLGMGLSYTFFWPRLIHAGTHWAQALDLWLELRYAHQVAWGAFGYVYSASSSLPGHPLSFSFPPGIFILLAPVAIVIDHFNLSQSSPLVLSQPTAWPLLYGYSLVISSVAVFGLDYVLKYLEVKDRRRYMAGLVGAVVLWPITAIWGHPEDCVSFGIALFALVEVLKHDHKRAGWLFGLSLLFQPLSGLMVLAAAGFLGLRAFWRISWRAVSIPIVSVSIPLIVDFTHAKTIFSQVTYPEAGWPTPWSQVVPKQYASPISALVGKYICDRGALARSTWVKGCHLYRPTHSVDSVLAGPPRWLAAIAAVAIGMYAMGHIRKLASRVPTGQSKASTEQLIVWACGSALVVRCLFEAVMFPYYIEQGLALFAILIATFDLKQALVTGVLILLTFGLVWVRMDEWLWYLALVLLIGALSTAGLRGTRSKALEPIS